MFIEPGIEVNPIKDQAPAQPDTGHAELHQQRDPDPQVDGGLFPRQKPHGRQRQIRLVHHRPCLAR
jgi:hypothetical protein